MYSISTENNKSRYIDNVENISIEIPSDCQFSITGKDCMPVMNENDLKKSVCNPENSFSLKETVLNIKAQSACILVSDATRNMPSAKAAGIIVDELLDAGMELSNIFFIVALGVHRDATEKEMRTIIGDDLYSKVSIENHTPFDRTKLVEIGITSFGTIVEVNRKAYECDLHISIGKVEPHEFAGFSGGRKSVLPGISSEKTIKMNHSVGMISSEKAVPGNMEGNPVSMDMIEAAEFFRLDYCVNFVLNSENAVSAVFSGPMTSSHNAAVSFLRKYCINKIEKPDLIVTTPGSLLNIDFYQSLKALIALTDIVDSSVTVAFYCECREGINSPDMMKPFCNSNDIEDVVRYLNENYKIQMDHSLLITKILGKKVNIVVYSPNVREEDLKNLKMVPCKNIEQMMEKSVSLCKKKNPKILFYPQPQKSLTEINQEEFFKYDK